MRRRVMRPSSGGSAMRVRAVIGPMPGTEVGRSSAARQAGEPRIRSSISWSSSLSAACKAARVRSMPCSTLELRAWRRRLASMPIISTIWRRRATSSAKPWACSEATGRGSGRTCSAKRAIGAASSRSVLASRPVARAKARTWAGLTTASGSPAPATAAATTASKPPVASRTTCSGASARGLPARSSSPAPSRATAQASPEGLMWTPRRSLETSMPTNMRPPGSTASPARACRCGLAATAARRRPKRLPGLSDAMMTDGAPHSDTGSIPPAGHGLPSTTTSLAGRRTAGN